MEKAERASAELRELVANAPIRSVFQAIADLHTGLIRGYEALTRFEDDEGRSPAEWFAVADAAGVGIDLELAAIRSALRHLGEVATDIYVSLNVSPALACSPRLRSVLAGVPLDRIVIEITEHDRIDDAGALANALADLRREGARVAIDDLGAGFANMSLVLHLRPDVIKLDIDLTRGIHHDPDRRALVASLVTFAGALGSTVVAEGIEEEEELAALVDLGVHCGQGYLLAKPGEFSLDSVRLGRVRIHRGKTSLGLAAHISALVRVADGEARYEPSKRRHGARLVVLAVVAATLFGSSAVAMADPAQPGDALWWLKVRIEDVRLFLEDDADQQGVLLTEFARRRVDELELIPAARADLVGIATARYRVQVGALRGLIARAEGELDQELSWVVAMLDRQEERIQFLERAACRARGASCGALRAAGRALDRGVRVATDAGAGSSKGGTTAPTRGARETREEEAKAEGGAKAGGTAGGSRGDARDLKGSSTPPGPADPAEPMTQAPHRKAARASRP